MGRKKKIDSLSNQALTHDKKSMAENYCDHLLGGQLYFQVPSDHAEGQDILKNISSILQSMDLGHIFSRDMVIDNPDSAGAAKNRKKSQEEFISGGFIDKLLDKKIHNSIAAQFKGIIGERLDTRQLSFSNKAYVSKWTNRVALYWFFERYYTKLYQKHKDNIKDEVDYYTMAINDKEMKTQIHAANPFGAWKHALNPIMAIWRPCIKNVINIFIQNTKGGYSLAEDFESIAYMAFLYTLEKQAMVILSNSKLAQGIPFPKRLNYAIRKAINREIPDMTGAVRIPIESEMRKHMPQIVSVDFIDDESFY